MSIMPASGEISMSNLQQVFGGTFPIGMDEYYSNAATQHSIGVSGIPVIGNVISINAFYGKRKGLQGNLIRRRFTLNNETASSSLAAMNTAFNNTLVTEIAFATNFTVPALETYGLEYTGWIMVSTSGSYQLGVRSDDGSDLAISFNGTSWDVVTTAYGLKPPESTPPNPGTRTLTAGLYYPIRIRMHEQGGGEALFVEWRIPGSSTWVSIPFSNFYCAATSPPTTTTVRANDYPEPRVP
jgi:hypothetical protein